jgi:hypothetical protein
MHRTRWCDDRGGPQELVCEALMIAFGVVVRREVGDRVLKRGLSEEDHSVQTLGFHRAHEAFGERIRVYPHERFSSAMRRMRSTIVFMVRGRPGPRRWLWFHFDATSSRCHRNRMSGVTSVSSSFNTLRPSAYAFRARRRRSASVRLVGCRGSPSCVGPLSCVACIIGCYAVACFGLIGEVIADEIPEPYSMEGLTPHL